MVEHFISDAEVAQRLRRGPLGPHLDSYAATIAALGFARSTTRAQLWFLAELGRWLQRQAISVADLDERVVEAFLSDRRSRRGGLRRSDGVSRVLSPSYDGPRWRSGGPAGRWVLKHGTDRPHPA